MAKKTKQDPREKALRAAMELAAKRGWDKVSMGEIAKKSGVANAAMLDYFDDKSDIVAFLGRMADRRALESPGDVDAPVRERLFDLMMERFDFLNQYRDGLIKVVESYRADPKQAVLGIPGAFKSMNRMLEAAGVDTTGPKGALAVAGMMCVYLQALHVWKDDKSEDMGKTMASLDKALGRAEQLANMMGF